MNQIYKRENFIVIPVCNDYIVINTNKVFKKGHTHVKSIGVARMLIDLCLEKRLPKNPHFANNLIRITTDQEYIKQLQQFKEDNFINYKELMFTHYYKRINGALRQVK